MYFCYVLANDYSPHINRTYNGCTNNIKRRLRQHNQEISGGAKYTRSFGNKSWKIIALLYGLPNYKNALQCEWKIRFPTGKKKCHKFRKPIGRIKAINKIIKLHYWTSNSIIDNYNLKLFLWIDNTYKNYISDIPSHITPFFVDSINIDDIDFSTLH